VIIGALVCVACVTLAILVTAAGFSSPLTIAVLVMTGVALALFSSLTVEIEKNTLTCRFGVGLIRRDIPLPDVEHVRAVVNPWYVGWGIRWIPGGCWVWNVSGLQAVELTMKDGRRFRIGTDEPEALVRAIEMAKNTGS
jgi:uncharacterized membrane protein